MVSTSGLAGGKLPNGIDLVTDTVRANPESGEWQCKRWVEVAPQAVATNDHVKPDHPLAQTADTAATASAAVTPRLANACEHGYSVTVDPTTLAPTYHPQGPVQLRDDEVEVDVRAYGLNFLDVLAATGVLAAKYFGGEVLKFFHKARRSGYGEAYRHQPLGGDPPG